MTTEDRWKLIQSELAVDADTTDNQAVEENLSRWWEDAYLRGQSDEILAGMFLKQSILRFLMSRARTRVDRQIGSDRISSGQLFRNTAAMLEDLKKEMVDYRRGDGMHLVSSTPLNRDYATFDAEESAFLLGMDVT
jgi:hypothetical protein